MKFLVILLSYIALAWAQDEAECKCGAFVAESTDVREVVNLPDVEVKNCHDDEDCVSGCHAQWDELTNNGDLDTILDNGVSAGQTLCNALAEDGDLDFGPKEVYAYSSLCGGPWLTDGPASRHPLLCKDGRYVPAN
ncbi:uncharacterized protein LOC121877807 [Homarus americanus]|uniref:Uncharacterized protein n=1 Tax=Homarus americanus TaxID=6706 RepID=A0A8J5JQ96_HOMAM|nr:uncharacterized protein LOC121877807 [Homarus americanus]KAG7159119.1 hypothetical protein Hamer_G016496 [Homarus americanus]